nr:uncharacterized protein At5g50100, chloroplastic isoform X2 [Arachis hypogaea]
MLLLLLGALQRLKNRHFSFHFHTIIFLPSSITLSIFLRTPILLLNLDFNGTFELLVRQLWRLQVPRKKGKVNHPITRIGRLKCSMMETALSVDMLRERNKSYGTIKFVDISSVDYSPEENQNLDYETVMGRIHAILSDGTVVKDVEAFRRLYEQVGLGWVYAITKYEPIGTIADSIYGVWAKYRLQITGRPPIEEILEARKKKGEVCKDSSACKM